MPLNVQGLGFLRCRSFYHFCRGMQGFAPVFFRLGSLVYRTGPEALCPRGLGAGASQTRSMRTIRRPLAGPIVFQVNQATLVEGF